MKLLKPILHRGRMYKQGEDAPYAEPRLLEIWRANGVIEAQHSDLDFADDPPVVDSPKPVEEPPKPEGEPTAAAPEAPKAEDEPPAAAPDVPKVEGDKPETANKPPKAPGRSNAAKKAEVTKK